MKLDLGCGPNKKEGHVGIDCRSFPGVDHVLDLGRDRWPFDDASVDEAHSSHMVEHLTSEQRIHFVNELHRVMKKGAKAHIITPHWAAARAYGDLTHQWPPVSEFWFLYLNAEWRKTNAPHNDGYTCDFDHSVGYSMHQGLNGRHQDHLNHALVYYTEARQDMLAVLTKR